VGGGLSWFASTRPDGLEWSIAKVAGGDEVAGETSVLHRRLSAVQKATAVLPDYGFREDGSGAVARQPAETEASEPWPAVRAGTSVSGLVGGLATLVLILLLGLALKARRSKPSGAKGR
jgi:cobalt/nickel transport system permease protein